MNSRQVALVALAAASVAVSACSNDAPEQLDLSPRPVAAGVTVPAAAPAGESAPRFVWENVDGQGRVQFDAGKPASQFGAVPAPGVSLLRGFDIGDIQVCSIGPAVTSAASGSGFLTAGHCSTRGDSDAPRVSGVAQHAETSPGGAKVPLGASAPVPGVRDAAVVWSARAAGATRIADTWAVAGVLTEEGVQRLVKPGDQVCFNGAVSGVRCGARVADEAGMIQFLHGAKEGDSGAPVFVVDSVTDTAVLIGLTKAADSSSTDAVYLEPVLDHLDASVLLDPNVTPLRGDGFSLRAAQ